MHGINKVLIFLPVMIAMFEKGWFSDRSKISRKVSSFDQMSTLKVTRVWSLCIVIWKQTLPVFCNENLFSNNWEKEKKEKESWSLCPRVHALF